MYDENKPVIHMAAWKQLLLYPIVLVLVFFFYSVIQLLITFIKNNALNWLASTWTSIVAMILFFLIGYGLFEFRRKRRVWYGASEVAVALATSIHWFSKNKTTGVELDLFAAATVVYIVVRGLDNIDAGRKEARAQKQSTLTASLTPTSKTPNQSS